MVTSYFRAQLVVRLEGVFTPIVQLPLILTFGLKEHTSSLVTVVTFPGLSLNRLWVGGWKEGGLLLQAARVKGQGSHEHQSPRRWPYPGRSGHGCCRSPARTLPADCQSPAYTRPSPDRSPRSPHSVSGTPGGSERAGRRVCYGCTGGGHTWEQL